MDQKTVEDQMVTGFPQKGQTECRYIRTEPGTVVKGDVMPTRTATMSAVVTILFTAWPDQHGGHRSSVNDVTHRLPHFVYRPDADSEHLECSGRSREEDDHTRPGSVQPCPLDSRVSWQQELDPPSRYTTYCIRWSTLTRKNS